MGDRTEISWTDATWNAIRGCRRVSKGCQNCYAERMASRFCDEGQPYEGIARRTDNGPRWTGTLAFIEDRLDQPIRWKRSRMIFVNSMSDLFWEEVPDEIIKLHFQIMREAFHHTYQILTKRPHRMKQFISQMVMDTVDGFDPFPCDYEHVWLGTSVESEEFVDRIAHLQDTPAAVRFLSVEPLIGPLDLRGRLDGIHWVIVGGESGPGARPMHPDWARNIRDTCADAGVAFHFKQWGGWTEASWDSNNPGPVSANERYLNLAGGHGFHGERVIKVRRASKSKAGRILDGKVWSEMPAGASVT